MKRSRQKMIFVIRFQRYTGLLVLSLALLCHTFTVKAFETDQYELPPISLADIGDEVSDHVEQKLHEAIDKLNAQIVNSESCLKQSAQPKANSCNAAEAKVKLAYLRSNEAVARAAYDELGAGIPPFSIMETWMQKNPFQDQPARYKVVFWKSIFFAWPLDHITLSPTVNLYGSEFGIDKIGHIFQQGYTYYEIYNRALAEGATPDEARRKAVEWGQKTEATIYGFLSSGVYSNADLAANYAGMKFYQGLAQDRNSRIKTPPILVLKNGLWAFNAEVRMREVLLRPLISDHLNEALNPSIFNKLLHWYVQRRVTNGSCAQWFNRYSGLSRAGLDEKTRSLELWYGEDYGFTNSKDFITIANTCFDENGNPKSAPSNTSATAVLVPSRFTGLTRGGSWVLLW
jgi:hypothetical protein